MHVFDASSMIHAWDTYPRELFEKLWIWIETQIFEQKIQIPKAAFDEINHKFPDCGKWLKTEGIICIPISNNILQVASDLKKLLNIEEDGYNPKGVDENDLLIIATASVNQSTLVSNESPLKNNPDIPGKRKIPVVCSMPDVDVACIDFLTYIKNSRKVF